MEYSVEDYYSILGLDPGASEESIKVVYRRLAREHHPDGKVDSTESERGRFSAYMAQLNGAYAVLSDAKLRREYDQKLKILSSLQSDDAVPRVTKTVSEPKSNERAAPHDDVDLIVARELSKQLRANLLAHHKGISWKDKALEGFDWGLEGSSWSSHFCVAGLGFGVLNLASARKFTNYSKGIIARCNRSVRKSHFLFLLAFQRLYEWESVSAEFNRFFSAESHTKFSDIPVEIALLDARQGQTTRFGGKSREKRLEELLQCVSATT
jgi:curved DNA-binding protein CbpA